MANKSLESVSKIRHLGGTVTDQIYIQDDIKSR